jgi:hypothetical protein
MIEIIVIWRMAVNIGRIADEKGLKKFPYQLMAVLLWICGELLAGIAGHALLGNNYSILLNYGVALLGAVAGSCIAFLVMRLLPKPYHLLTQDGIGIVGLNEELTKAEKFKRSGWIPALVILMAFSCLCVGFGGAVILQVRSNFQQIHVNNPLIGTEINENNTIVQPTRIIDSKTEIFFLAFYFVNPSDIEFPLTFVIFANGNPIVSTTEKFTSGYVAAKFDRNQLGLSEFPKGNYEIKIRTGSLFLASTTFVVQ